MNYWVIIDIFALTVIVAISFVNRNTLHFSEEIEENRTISECMNGYKLSLKTRDPQMYITTSEYAKKEGYPAEEHVVVTKDGYILTAHRIVGPAGSTPIFVQNSLTTSSFEWVGAGRQQALAFKLADAGYDVWLGNARGTTYSRCHTKYKTSSFEFWDFSWHEIGIYDLPAMITYVTNATSQKVIYIGHSMGATEFFVMSSELPEVTSKDVKLMIGLAPVIYLDHGASPVFVFTPLFALLQYYIKFTGTGEFLTSSSTLKIFFKYACILTRLQTKICLDIASPVLGIDSHRFNYVSDSTGFKVNLVHLKPTDSAIFQDFASEIFFHYPGGTSMKSFIHFSQVYSSGRFQYYDYGAEKNLQLYNSSIPPVYSVSKMTVPIGLIWSDNDIYANKIDVLRLYKKLPNALLNYRIKDPNFNHADYFTHIDAPKLVYEKVLSFIDKYK